MAPNTGLRIVRIEVNNFMGIKVAELTPGQGVNLIGGDNGAGKSSFLRAIEVIFQGKKSHPKVPVHRGAEESVLYADLGELKLTKVIKANGDWSVKVENAEGGEYRNTAVMLERLFGAFSFDPLAFVELPPKEQVGVIQQLAGIDTAKIEAKGAKLFEERTGVNRDLKLLAGQAAGMPHHEECPAEIVDVSALMTERARCVAVNEAADTLVTLAKNEKALVADYADDRETQRSILVSAEAAVVQARSDVERATSAHLRQVTISDEATEAADHAVREPLAPIDEQIQGAEGINTKVRENAAQLERSEQADAKAAEAAKLTEQIDALREQRRALIASAELPVDGLEWTSAGVTLDETPFEQCSTAEQLRASVLMGMATHPRLDVMLIRHGSALDDKSLEMVTAMADEANYQMFIERVGEDAGAIMIEAGEIRGAEPVAEEGGE